MDPDVTKETSFESALYGVSVPRSLGQEDGIYALGHEDGIYEGPSSVSRPGVASNDDVLDGDDPDSPSTNPKYSKVRKPIGAVRLVNNGTSLHISCR